jgi:hypothetical protein
VPSGLASAVRLHIEIVANLQYFRRLLPLASQIVIGFTAGKTSNRLVEVHIYFGGWNGQHVFQQGSAWVGFDKEHSKNPDEQVINVGRGEIERDFP